MHTVEEIKIAIENSKSIADTCRWLGLSPCGGNYATIKKYINRYNIDITHFDGQLWNKGKKQASEKSPRLFLPDILQKGIYYPSFKLKHRLLNVELKKNQCEKCGIVQWNGEPIALELHHINGDKTDNRLENLQILCPNCHSQTENFRSKKHKCCQELNSITEEQQEIIDRLKDEKNKILLRRQYRKNKKNTIEKFYQYLESYDLIKLSETVKSFNEMALKLDISENIIRKFCKENEIIDIVKNNFLKKRNRCVITPTKELICKYAKEKCNFTYISSKFGVSDNALRKWCKKLGLPMHKKELKAYIDNQIIS